MTEAAVRLLIASPSYTGFSPGFVSSILSTSEALRERGIHLGFFCQHQAEVALARALLVQEFMTGAWTRGPWTHLLMVDSDVGWRSETLLRMLDRDVDFIVAALPLKLLQPAFAIPNMGAWSLPDVDGAEVDGTIQVPAAGVAFALLRRIVIERISIAHPELHCRDGYYCLFDPIVMAGNRATEDISFCIRWRRVGGAIWLLRDAPLQHHGPFTFTGNYAETPTRVPSPQRPQSTVAPPEPPARLAAAKVGRNEPCPCGSGLKWKRCHGASEGS